MTGRFNLFSNVIIQKGISKKLQPNRKRPYQIIDEHTDVPY